MVSIETDHSMTPEISAVKSVGRFFSYGSPVRNALQVVHYKCKNGRCHGRNSAQVRWPSVNGFFAALQSPAKCPAFGRVIP